MGLSSFMQHCTKVYGNEGHNEFTFYKSYNNQYPANNNPSVKDLISDKNVKHAVIHDSKQTIFVSHDDNGKAYYGEVNHKNEENAKEFVNYFLPKGNKYLLDN